MLELGLILLVCLAGEWIAALLPFAFPASVISMILLAVLLMTGILRERLLSTVSKFLVANMGLFFVPALVGTLEYTDVLKTALIPFLLTCLVYGLVGVMTPRSGAVLDLQAIFGGSFALNWIALLPALVILALSLMQINVKIAMTASILVSLPICLFVQHTAPAELPGLLLNGYRAADPEVAAMLNGGGILSMVRVTAIVCLSSSYSGIFQKTGLLDGAKQAISALADRTGPFAATLLTSAVAGMIACNQTLTIMLTNQLCGQVEPDRSRFANQLEDSAVLVAPMVPWSIAGAVPLASINAPTASILFACFLYLVPLCHLIGERFGKRTK
jgi:NhaC family Na+:H+ antiporter